MYRVISCNSSSKRTHEICKITSTPITLSSVVYFVFYFSLLSLCFVSGPWPGGICFPSACVTESITQQAGRSTSWARSMFRTVQFTVIKYYRPISWVSSEEYPDQCTRLHHQGMMLNAYECFITLSRRTSFKPWGRSISYIWKTQIQGSGNDVKPSETKRAVYNLFIFSFPIYKTTPNLNFFSTYVCSLFSSVWLRKLTSLEMVSPSKAILSEGV